MQETIERVESWLDYYAQSADPEADEIVVAIDNLLALVRNKTTRAKEAEAMVERYRYALYQAHIRIQRMSLIIAERDAKLARIARGIPA